MEVPPPVKPPRGVKPTKETSGLLMSVIRTLSSSETNEQRDREKAKLESEYRICDRKLDELVSVHESDLTQVMQLFGSVSQVISENREKIAKVKSALFECKEKLRCRRDELKSLWLEGLEYKYMLQLLDEIEQLNNLPQRLASHIGHKQYLHAAKLLVEGVQLGRNTLEGVESLKELSQDLEQRKEQLHSQLLSDLKNHLYIKPSQQVMSLRRQTSGGRGDVNHAFGSRSPLRRSSEMRSSARRRKSAIPRNTSFSRLDNKDETDSELIENLEIINPEEDSTYFLAILVKSLSLLDKLPSSIQEIKTDMQQSISAVVKHTTQYVRDLMTVPNNPALDERHALKELMQILFEQLRSIAESHSIFLKHVLRFHTSNTPFKSYNMQFYWVQVQIVLEGLLNDYITRTTKTQIDQDRQAVKNKDLTEYFIRRKQTQKKKFSMFKFEYSSSGIAIKEQGITQDDKVLICEPHPNNILILFVPLMRFVAEIEKSMDIECGASQLHHFVTQKVLDGYFRRKSEEIMDHIESAVRSSHAWKATVLLDLNADYKPLLVSTVTVERWIREWKVVLQYLPIYSEKIAQYAYKSLKEYKETCVAAYQGIVQPHTEDKRICSAAWLKDDDISRFLKSLPNWLSLKAQQEWQARNERSSRRAIRREQPSEEESPEDVRMRNRREAEILASNLGEGGVSASEILGDISLLKELAQLQETMEWFSVRMLQFASEFRHEPVTLMPTARSDVPQTTEISYENTTPISASTLHQLTSVAQEFDELANTCLLLLHLEVRVQCFHYLLAQVQHSNRETHEPDPKVLELSRVLANVDEAMTSSLHPRKCKYIFEGLGHLIAKILISSAQYMKRIDDSVIQRMCRNIFALQQSLTNITMTREVALDHARHYFELFFLEPKDILDGIVEKGAEFSELEYMNAIQLLHRSKPNKHSTNVADDLKRMSDILGGVGVKL